MARSTFEDFKVLGTRPMRRISSSTFLRNIHAQFSTFSTRAAVMVAHQPRASHVPAPRRQNRFWQLWHRL